MDTETGIVSLACARSAMMYSVGKRIQHCCSHLRTKDMMFTMLKAMFNGSQTSVNIHQHRATM